MEISNKFIKSSMIAFLLLAILGIGCTNNEVQDPAIERAKLIDDKIKERVDVYRADKLKKCRKLSMDKAEKQVDEKLILEFKQLMNDTLVFPEKPFRPPMPENLYLDTIGVQKIELNTK